VIFIVFSEGFEIFTLVLLSGMTVFVIAGKKKA